MAVYTQLGAEVLARLIAEFDVGELRSAKGIAEGVSNSNWLIETSGARAFAASAAHEMAASIKRDAIVASLISCA